MSLTHPLRYALPYTSNTVDPCTPLAMMAVLKGQITGQFALHCRVRANQELTRTEALPDRYLNDLVRGPLLQQ